MLNVKYWSFTFFEVKRIRNEYAIKRCQISFKDDSNKYFIKNCNYVDSSNMLIKLIKSKINY